MRRYALDELLKWKENINKKPLIIRGPRQVGKTWLMKEFGKHYKKAVYFNFDTNNLLGPVFNSGLDVSKILDSLSHISKIKIDEDTLIIFDEIQELPKALTSLKYFNEDAPNCHIVAAGSLLGIAFHQGTSFPVGKVDFLDLAPLSFFEFLEAINEKELVEIVKYQNLTMINIYHDKYIEYLQKYMYIGGMPEVVQNFATHNDFSQVKSLQKKILEAYELDFSKHAPASIATKIRLLLNSTAAQLSKENKKFVYGMVKEGARAKDLEVPMQWLLDCGIIYKVNRVAKAGIPLRHYEDTSAFKVYLRDVGLMSAMCDLHINSIIEKNNIFQEFKGTLTEQYVLNCLLNNVCTPYYWTPDAGRAELDFVVQIENTIAGIEVKAAENLLAKSLKVFREKYPEATAIRTSLTHYKKEENLVNIPLYLMESFKQFL